AVVAAQQVRKALVVHDVRRRPNQPDGLCIGAIGKIETLEPVISGSQAEPSFGVARVQLDRLAEMSLGEAVAALPEVFLADAQIVGGTGAQKLRLQRRRTGCGVGCRFGTEYRAGDVGVTGPCRPN